SSAQAAWGRLYNSVGLDTLPKEIEKHDIKTLAREIQRTLDDQERANLLVSTQGTPNVIQP
ncbi:MAG: TolC family protein, partial [Pseudomonas sp.]